MSLQKGNDNFADIALKGIKSRDNSLTIKEPIKLEEKFLKNDYFNKNAIFVPKNKINTKEQLKEEVNIQKKYYDKFLQDFAPRIKNNRIRKYLESFQWRIQKINDKKNFIGVLLGEGNWEEVRIPHFGGPLGKKTTYYRTEFSITKEDMSKGTLYICFNGVDYKAKVFVNGKYIGEHEGFFAPFEFEMTDEIFIGKNTLVVEVENDYICMGSFTEESEIKYTGDKIYAATGIGYDDSIYGWHHCPPGMGIYQDVYIEARSRVHIKDIFVRPLLKDNSAEAWIEVESCDIDHKDITFEISLYGQNFKEITFEKYRYKPTSNLTVGVGDSFSEAKIKAEGKLNSDIELKIEKGTNYFIIPFKIDNPKLWELDKPYLYQLQVTIIDINNKFLDSQKRQFGMRSFEVNENSNPKGKFLLNGKEIKLRGANTMGNEQQCVAKKDWNQLLEDMLLAKICNMNFLRLTQRPVQSEVYDLCDKLGLMTQTDLPLFGMLRKNKFVEAVRQTEEMEKFIRSHPCNIIVSYINEPFPNANNMPHRGLIRGELEEFFKAADIVVKLNNPDRVIKKVDGDYDPPTVGLQDNHCYPCWYNGHGIDIGRLNKGYWMKSKPDWNYGCGEFGAEGLDPVNVMKKYYPKDWLPKNEDEEKNWFPNKIIGAQTGNFHYFFYETQNSLENWVKESHKHQAWATKIMTEAFRRDRRMNTFAIHLFIDAFPSGWMKSLMDVERTPKPAYFSYREALMPLMVNIRTDKYKFFESEEVKLEAWICNDNNWVPKNAKINYQLEIDDEIFFAQTNNANVPLCSSEFQGYISFKAPKVKERKNVNIRLALISEEGEVLNDTLLIIEVFPTIELKEIEKVIVLGEVAGKAKKLAKEMNLVTKELDELSDGDTIIVDNYFMFKKVEKDIFQAIESGGKLIFLELEEGDYEIFDKKFNVKSCSMLPLHFVSRNTNSNLVKGFGAEDFKLWFDRELGYITPLLNYTFIGENINQVLTSGNTNSKGLWEKALAVGEFKIGKGTVVISQIHLAGRINDNPIAKIFAKKLFN